MNNSKASAAGMHRRCYALRRHNGQEAVSHPVSCKQFEKLEAVTVQRGICSEKPKNYWNDKENNGPQQEEVLFQVYLHKAANTMKRWAYVMYPVHAVLLKFRAALEHNLVSNGHTLVGFLYVQNEEDYCTIQSIDELDCSGNDTIREKSELVHLKNFTAHTTVLNGREEEVKVVPKGTPSILDDTYRYTNEGVEVIMQESSCQRLIPFVQLYCSDTPEGITIFVVRHETAVDHPCIQCLVSFEKFFSLDWAENLNMSVMLSACKEYAMNMIKS